MRQPVREPGGHGPVSRLPASAPRGPRRAAAAASSTARAPMPLPPEPAEATAQRVRRSTLPLPREDGDEPATRGRRLLRWGRDSLRNVTFSQYVMGARDRYSHRVSIESRSAERFPSLDLGAGGGSPVGPVAHRIHPRSFLSDERDAISLAATKESTSMPVEFFTTTRSKRRNQQPAPRPLRQRSVPPTAN